MVEIRFLILNYGGNRKIFGGNEEKKSANHRKGKPSKAPFKYVLSLIIKSIFLIIFLQN